MSIGGGTGIGTGEQRRILQDRNLGFLVQNKGFQFSETFFPYTSGQIGNYYVQSADVMKHGTCFSRAVRDMRLMIDRVLEEGNEPEIDFVSGGESRDWIFSYPIACTLERPHFTIYKDGKTLGADVKGKRGIHVADLNNEGSSPRDLWLPAIKKAGGEVKYIFFYVDRMEDGVQVMQELGLVSNAVVSMDAHAWETLLQTNAISPEVYDASMQRLEDKGAWAREMLRSERGLERLAELARDTKSVEKAKKILAIGYPDMKDELTEKLAERGVVIAA